MNLCYKFCYAFLSKTLSICMTKTNFASSLVPEDLKIPQNISSVTIYQISAAGHRVLPLPGFAPKLSGFLVLKNYIELMGECCAGCIRLHKYRRFPGFPFPLSSDPSWKSCVLQVVRPQLCKPFVDLRQHKIK
jgi:hypothetical protein